VLGASRHLGVQVGQRLGRREPRFDRRDQGESEIGPAEQGETSPECPSGLRARDGKEDRGQQDGEGKREESAFPGFARLPQGSEAHAEDQEEDDEGADVEPEAPHGLVSRSLQRNPPTTILRDSGCLGEWLWNCRAWIPMLAEAMGNPYKNWRIECPVPPQDG